MNNKQLSLFEIDDELLTYLLLKVATPDQKVDTSGKVATSDEIAENQNLTSTKVATSENEMHSFHGKNIKREELERIILRLCKDEYVKKEELAKQLGKSENYVRNRILPDLLKSGKLVKRFPYTHNHPDQGYKTNEEHAKGL